MHITNNNLKKLFSHLSIFCFVLTINLISLVAKGQNYSNDGIKYTTKKVMELAEKLPLDARQPKDTLFDVQQITPYRHIIVCRNNKGEICHVGISLAGIKGFQYFDKSYQTFMERMLLEILLCNSESAAVRKLSEFGITLSFSKITLLAPCLAINAFLKHLSSTSNFFQSSNGKEMSFIWKFGDATVFKFNFPAVRELIEGTDKMEADKLVFDLLDEIRNSDAETENLRMLPSSCRRMEDSPLFVLPGTVYSINNMKSDTYYLENMGEMTPVFSPLYVSESLNNLFLGAIFTDHTLQINHRQYGNKLKTIKLPLSKFVSYWRNKKNFSCFCGINTMHSQKLQVVLIIVNNQLQYIHMLKIEESKVNLFNKNATLSGDFYTNIPQQSVISIL